MSDTDPATRRLIIETSKADELIALIAGSAISDEVSIRFLDEKSERGIFTEDFIQSPSGLFAWAKDPESDVFIPVITGENLVHFAITHCPSVLKGSNPQRFFSRIVQHFRYDRKEGADYVLFKEQKEEEGDALGDIEGLTALDAFAGSGAQSFEAPPGVLGIKLESALDLLRRLKQEDIGEIQPYGTRVGIWFVGKTTINFFEEYCRAVFPRVDIEQATRGLDLVRADAMLGRSELRRRAWGWAGVQAVGTVFQVQGVEQTMRRGGLGQYFNELQAVGLIDHKPEGPPRTPLGNEPVDHPHWPFRKLFDYRWYDLNQLLIKRGVIGPGPE